MLSSLNVGLATDTYLLRKEEVELQRVTRVKQDEAKARRAKSSEIWDRVLEVKNEFIDQLHELKNLNKYETGDYIQLDVRATNSLHSLAEVWHIYVFSIIQTDHPI